MRKRHRDIVVNGTKYAWTINNGGDGDGGNDLKIWLNKKVIYEDIIGGHIEITPKMISEIIKELENGNVPVINDKDEI